MCEIFKISQLCSSLYKYNFKAYINKETQLYITNVHVCMYILYAYINSKMQLMYYIKMVWAYLAICSCIKWENYGKSFENKIK